MENNQLQTINIKGKQYVEVNTRVLEFRTNPKYEGWSLETEIITITDESVLMKAIIRDNNRVVIATGYAQEDKSASMVNSTSYVENCETSAWGRALGNLGIGIKTSIASANEVSHAIDVQNSRVAMPPQQAVKQQPYNQQIQDEVVALQYGNATVNWKKCFNKAKNEYFYALQHQEDISITGKKFISEKDMNTILGK